MLTVHTKLPQLSGTALKRIACVSMLLDHIGASVLEAGFLPRLMVAAGLQSATVFSMITAPGALGQVALVDWLLRSVGRIAFPIYCFLLVEGFVHTHDFRRYLLRMGFFALVSEAAFDFAFFGGVYMAHQNVYFTLFAGLAALFVWQRFSGRGWAGRAVAVAGVFLCAGLAELCCTDYGALGVLLIFVLYFFRSRPLLRTVVGCLAVCYEPAAMLAFVLLWWYSGTRGRCSKAEQLAFYWFYPVHLALLALAHFLMF